MAVTSSPASSAKRGASSSADEMKKAVEPYEAHQDEIDRDNMVQQPRHEQNQDAASESNERHQMMGDGGQPHGGGLLFLFRVELPLVTFVRATRSSASPASARTWKSFPKQ